MAKQKNENIEEVLAGEIPAETVCADIDGENRETAAPVSFFSDDAKLNELGRKLKKVFTNYPTVDILYHDEKDVYFEKRKVNMTVVRRVDFIKNKE